MRVQSSNVVLTSAPRQGGACTGGFSYVFAEQAAVSQVPTTFATRTSCPSSQPGISFLSPPSTITASRIPRADVFPANPLSPLEVYGSPAAFPIGDSAIRCPPPRQLALPFRGPSTPLLTLDIKPQSISMNPHWQGVLLSAAPPLPCMIPQATPTITQMLTSETSKKQYIPIVPYWAIATQLPNSAAVRVAPGLASAIVDPIVATPANRSTQKITMVPYGVLGTQMTNSGEVQVASEPDSDTAIVDPAGLKYIQKMGPGGAGAASGAIYKWLNIRSDRSFPEPVQEGIRATGHAKYYCYDEKSVVHVVGPDFRESGYEDEAAATDALAKAYANTLSEFLTSNCSVLRLLPISGGVFAGPFKEDIPKMTFAALSLGINQLPADAKQDLCTRQLELCIFSERDWSEFKAAKPANVNIEEVSGRPEQTSQGCITS